MKVYELYKWLESQDQDAIVEVVEHTSGSNYYCQGGNATLAEFVPAKHAQYTDLRGNQFIKSDSPYYNKRVLQLGCYDQ